MEHVKFVLPFHTVFYTPHYLAVALGLFAGEGVDVEQATAAVPNGVARALLDGTADVGLSGPIRALGAADRGEGRLLCVAGHPYDAVVDTARAEAAVRAVGAA